MQCDHPGCEFQAEREALPWFAGLDDPTLNYCEVHLEEAVARDEVLGLPPVPPLHLLERA